MCTEKKKLKLEVCVCMCVCVLDDWCVCVHVCVDLFYLLESTCVTVEVSGSGS